eukprot:6458269-Amphidinium_carterae.1
MRCTTSGWCMHAVQEHGGAHRELSLKRGKQLEDMHALASGKVSIRPHICKSFPKNCQGLRQLTTDLACKLLSDFASDTFVARRCCAIPWREVAALDNPCSVWRAHHLAD